jgi:hypothetical protein
MLRLTPYPAIRNRMANASYADGGKVRFSVQETQQWPFGAVISEVVAMALAVK